MARRGQGTLDFSCSICALLFCIFCFISNGCEGFNFSNDSLHSAVAVAELCPAIQSAAGVLRVAPGFSGFGFGVSGKP